MPGEVETKSIPISGGQNTSADAATQATTLVANTIIGPAGESIQRGALVDTGTTGLTAGATVTGIWQWKTWVIIVTSDRKLWAMPQGSPYTVTALSDATAATQLAGTARPVFSADGLPRVVIAGGNSIQQWTGAGLSSVLVTSGHSPAATHVAYLGQRFIANDVSNPTQWFWSDPFDAAHQSWTASQFTVADASPDSITGVYATVREAYIFGEKTIQVYGIGQDPLNPFEPLNTVQLGCSAPYSPLDVDGSWLFMDAYKRITRTDGRQFEVLSNDVSLSLSAMATVSDCWSYRQESVKESIAGFVFPTEKREFIYDLDDKAWKEADYYGVTSRTLRPIGCQTRWDAFNTNLLGSTIGPSIYRIDETVRSDLGNPLTMERITGWLDHGTRSRKRSVRVRCIIRRGTGGATGTSDALELRVADDGGPWGDWETMPIGLAGDNDQHLDAYVGGVFRRRRYQFRYSGTQSMALLSAEEHYIEGNS